MSRRRIPQRILPAETYAVSIPLSRIDSLFDQSGSSYFCRAGMTTTMTSTSTPSGPCRQTSSSRRHPRRLCGSSLRWVRVPSPAPTMLIVSLPALLVFGAFQPIPERTARRPSFGDDLTGVLPLGARARAHRAPDEPAALAPHDGVRRDPARHAREPRRAAQRLARRAPAARGRPEQLRRRVGLCQRRLGMCVSSAVVCVWSGSC